MDAPRASAAHIETAAGNHAWEKEFAPKVTQGQVWVAVALYAAWMAFLTYVAVDRWTGTLQ